MKLRDPIELKVVGCRIDGQDSATVTLGPSNAGVTVAVRPKRSKTVYTVTLAEVAEMVAWRAAKKWAQGGGR